jgi:TPR repeat protein
MEQLASMYESGQGVRRDLNEARTWYQSAADAGSQTAAKWLQAHPAR